MKSKKVDVIFQRMMQRGGPAHSMMTAGCIKEGEISMAATPHTEVEAISEQETVHDAAEVEETLQHSHQPTKLELKRQQQYQERLRRFMNKGMTEEQAKEAIAKEDWNNLSPDKKVARLQHFTVMVTSGLRYDIEQLQANDGELADAMDINFRAFAKILEKLGITPEQQRGFIAEAQAEIEADKQKKAAAQRQASELDMVKGEARQDEASGPVEVPEGATEFGS